MKLKYYLIPLLFFILKTEAYGQSGLLRTETGLMAFYSSDSGSFTLRLDEPLTEIPDWISGNRLQLFDGIYYLQLFDPRVLNINTHQSSKDILEDFKKWETNYIDTSINKSVEKSNYINDYVNLNNETKDLEYNAWFYYIIIDNKKHYFYFLDAFYKGFLFRYEFNGLKFAEKGLEAAKLFTSECSKNMHLYPKSIDLKKLQSKLKEGIYIYE